VEGRIRRGKYRSVPPKSQVPRKLRWVIKSVVRNPHKCGKSVKKKPPVPVPVKFPVPVSR